MSCPITFKPAREKEKTNLNSKVVLRSEDGDEIAYLSDYFFYFDNDKLMHYNVLVHDRNPDQGFYINPTPIGKNVFGVSTDYQGETALILVGEYHNKEGSVEKEGLVISSSTFGALNRNLIPEIEEQKTFYIKPVGSEIGGKKKAALYDLEGNEIKNLSGAAFFYKGDTGSTICGISFDSSPQCFGDSSFYAVGEKIGDKYNIRIEDGDSLGYEKMTLSLNSDAFLRMKTKIDLCNQIEIANKEKEALCKELDEASMLMSEEHHKCVSELAKANFIMDQATYDTDTYM